MPRRPTVTEVSLPMILDGKFDPDGNDNIDWSQGLYENLMWLRQFVSDPTMVGDGTRYLQLTSPNGMSFSTGYAHLNLLEGDRAGPIMRAVLEVSIPMGTLQPLGS